MSSEAQSLTQPATAEFSCQASPSTHEAGTMISTTGFSLKALNTLTLNGETRRRRKVNDIINPARAARKTTVCAGKASALQRGLLAKTQLREVVSRVSVGTDSADLHQLNGFSLTAG